LQQQPRATASVFAGVVSLVLLGLIGWLAYGNYHVSSSQHEQQGFISAGRQAALDLTTIDHN
jgi:hypothetical protein